MDAGWQATVAAGIAGSVGLAELLGRYKSSPGFSLLRFAAGLYVVINAAAGFLALYLVRAFGWSFNQTQHVTLWRILVAGFGAIALFRSSLFVTKVGSTDLNVGPSIVLGAILDACDRSIDRASASELSLKINDKNLTGFDPDAIEVSLPVLCLALMQNFAPADQALLAADLSKISTNADLPPEARMRATIIQLSKYLGPEVVSDMMTNARSLFVNPPAQSILSGSSETTDALRAAVLPKAAELRSQSGPSQTTGPTSPTTGPATGPTSPTTGPPPHTT
jgi:hypothetical protein